ncbi:MAG: YbaN family protein [Acidobacteriota bacterium]|nr:MAG: YbaN family protein [Acidobacteriota bacterium]
MLRSTKRFIFLTLGIVAVGLGFIGAFLPLLPTTPFLLLAAFFFSKSSERLHQWLLNHKMFGKLIRDWRQHGAIAPRAKFFSMALIVPMYSYTLFFYDYHIVLKGIVAALAVWSTVFILTRPNGPKKEPVEVPSGAAEQTNS